MVTSVLFVFSAIQLVSHAEIIAAIGSFGPVWYLVFLLFWFVGRVGYSKNVSGAEALPQNLMGQGGQGKIGAMIDAFSQSMNDESTVPV